MADDVTGGFNTSARSASYPSRHGWPVADVRYLRKSLPGVWMLAWNRLDQQRQEEEDSSADMWRPLMSSREEKGPSKVPRTTGG